MRRKYALEEAKKTGRPPETEVFAYNTKEDFEQASVGSWNPGGDMAA